MVSLERHRLHTAACRTIVGEDFSFAGFCVVCPSFVLRADRVVVISNSIH